MLTDVGFLHLGSLMICDFTPVNKDEIPEELEVPCRQHIAAGAIERAEANDYSEVRSVLRLLQTPYEEQGFSMAEKYASVPPDWSHQLTLT